MSTHIALALHHQTPAGLAALADTIANGIDTSPLFKSTPSPVASALLRQTGAGVVAAGSKQQQAKHDAAAATQALHGESEGLITLLGKVAHAAEIQLADLNSPGDVEKAVLALGFTMKAKPVHHKDIAAPAGLNVSVGDVHGEVDWHCHGHPHRKDVTGYRLEAGDPTKPESFKQVQFSTKSKGTATGLPSGQLLGFRVVLVGTDSRESPPSQVVTVFVP